MQAHGQPFVLQARNMVLMLSHNDFLILFGGAYVPVRIMLSPMATKAASRWNTLKAVAEVIRGQGDNVPQRL